ncbi:MAG TPA: DUF2911 domain-containing protein [Bacteroidia bacterium]|nr:DUF2911 domain-containing protein [Bacteroidia bacterium]
MKTSYSANVICSLMVAISLFSSAGLNAQGITTPRAPSPAASVSQTIGLSVVTVNYSRPSVRERVIWGKLVPYGYNKEPFGNGSDAPWRAGANENTTITFSTDVKVEGKPVPAGTYGFFIAVFDNNTAEVILSKDYQSWGNFFYNPKQDQLRVKINTKESEFTELLTYTFDDVSANSTVLTLKWEKKQFPVKLEFNVEDVVMDNAATELNGIKGFNWQSYNSAAVYAVQNNTHLQQADVWSAKAVSLNPNFTTLNVRSQVMEKSGNKTLADSLSAAAFKVATEAEVNAYGYQLLNQGKHDKAIEVFIINTKNYPKSANCFDSLGEAYATKGDTKNAIANFKKALSMHPSDNVKANSEKFLKQLGAK